MNTIKEHKYVWYKFGCKDATYLNTKASYRKLSFSESVLYFFHLLICKYCRRFVQQVKNLENALKNGEKNQIRNLPEERKVLINQSITDFLRKNNQQL